MSDAVQLRVGAPRRFWRSSGTAFTNFSLDANNDGVAVTFPAKTADAITHLGFRYGLRTGTPPTYIIALESPDPTSGKPDGTVLGGGSPASATFTPPADTTWDGKWQWIALANSYTPTRGQKLAMTIRYSSGTVDGSNFSSATYQVTNATTDSEGIPYYNLLTAGTWGSNTAGAAAFAPYGYKTASYTEGDIVESIYTTRTASTAGLRVAIGFTIPSAWASSSYTLVGMSVQGAVAAASGKTPLMGLWDTTPATLQSITLDSEINADSNSISRTSTRYFDESSLSVLSPGVKYYAGFEIVDAANGSLGIAGYGVSATTDLQPLPMGASMFLATWDGAAWTDLTTTRPMAELIFQDITQSAGGGGGQRVIGG